MNPNNIKIAIQKSGRLSERSGLFLRERGIFLKKYNGSLRETCPNTKVDVLFLRDDDIPSYVEKGAADFGIVGLNVLKEKVNDVKILENLGFANCRLSFAAPKNFPFQSIEDLEGKRIATSYPRSVRKYLDQNDISAEIIVLKGSVELAPALNLADVICDLVATGKTLKQNGLKEIETIFESEAVLIGQKAAKNIFNFAAKYALKNKCRIARA